MAKNKNADPFPWLTEQGKRNTGYQAYVPQSQPQPQPQPRPQPRPQAAQNTQTAATAQAEIDAMEKKRIAREKAEADARTEQNRYEGVSKKEGEKRRKEFEEKSRSYAGKATGGQAFIEAPMAPSAKISSRTTTLGLPRDTSAFTKFGESINRAANLTFSSPQTRFGGM
jgi:hypothetical protein